MDRTRPLAVRTSISYYYVAVNPCFKMIFLAFFIVVLCTIIWQVFRKHEEDPLERVPGPPRNPIFGNSLKILKTDTKDLFKIMLEHTKQYGDRYAMKLFGMWILHINNPADVEIALSNTKNITKGFAYTFLQPWLGNGLLLSTGTKWRHRRKALTPTFHFNVLKNFFNIMEEKSKNLVTTLKESKENEVDVLSMLNAFTLYVICETAMGTQLDKDQSGASDRYKYAITNLSNLLLARFSKFWLRYDAIFKRTALGKQFQESLNIADTFASKVVEERRRQFKQKDDSQTITGDGTKKTMAFLDLLLEAEQNGEIDYEGIREEVNTFMFAGHDTTALALTMCLMILADHEDVQERIYEECQNMFERCEGKPSMSDFSEMKYLDAVIKESLRLYPSAPSIGRQVEEDFMMRDLLVKKGTMVSIDLYSIHHREDIYPDAEQFKPERFLNGEARHPYAFVPFSAGPRNCIGQKFAMLEMRVALYELIRNFKLKPKIKGWRPPLSSAIVIRPMEPIRLKFIPRNQ